KAGTCSPCCVNSRNKLPHAPEIGSSAEGAVSNQAHGHRMRKCDEFAGQSPGDFREARLRLCTAVARFRSVTKTQESVMRRFDFREWIRKVLDGQLLSKPTRTRQARWRPRLEILEDRTVLSKVTWINPQGGDWDTKSNWSTGQLPGVGDDVV